MNRTYEEWLEYYKNATKEQVIEDMYRDIQELNKYKEANKKARKYISQNAKSFIGDIRNLFDILNGDDK